MCIECGSELELYAGVLPVLREAMELLFGEGATARSRRAHTHELKFK